MHAPAARAVVRPPCCKVPVFCATVLSPWRSCSPRETRKRSRRSGVSLPVCPSTSSHSTTSPSVPRPSRTRTPSRGMPSRRPLRSRNARETRPCRRFGLEVDALGGAPGVYSARYAPDAESGNDPKNYTKLLDDLINIPPQERGARFVCCLALAYPDGRTRTFFGYAEGHIGRESRVKRGSATIRSLFPRASTGPSPK